MTGLNLTRNEILVLNAMRTNEYNDAIEFPVYSFTVIDNSGLSGRVARGSISSLVKKGLVVASTYKATEDNPESLSLTDEGVKLFEEADGEENKGWGGPRLLREPLPEKKPSSKKSKKEAPKVAVLKAFTGMVIGEYELKDNGVYFMIEVKPSKSNKHGILLFEKTTLSQVNAKNRKFANRIELK